MAKNNNNGTFVKIKRALNGPELPYLADSKLDHAMHELKRSRSEVKKLKLYLLASIIINVILGGLLWMT